jgi:hypothetical protein
MAIDTLFVYCGVYSELDDALVDYEVVKQLHTQENLIDAYDAAVIERTRRGRSRSPRSTRRRRGSGACSVAVWPCDGPGHRALSGRGNRWRAAPCHDGWWCLARFGRRTCRGRDEPR